MTIHEKLCSAVREHRIVEFAYDGRERRVEPYVIWNDSTWRLVARI